MKVGARSISIPPNRNYKICGVHKMDKREKHQLTPRNEGSISTNEPNWKGDSRDKYVETKKLHEKWADRKSSKYVLVMCDVDLCMLHHETMIGFKL